MPSSNDNSNSLIIPGNIHLNMSTMSAYYQQQPLASDVCPTIKANARLRRSRGYDGRRARGDVMAYANGPDENRNPSNSNGYRRTRHNNKNGRSPAYTILKKMNSDDEPSSDEYPSSAKPLEAHHCDASTTSTLSTDPSTDDSFEAACPATKPRRRRTRNRNRKSGPATPEIVRIVADLSDEEKSRYVALDAEMVGVGPGGYHSRLARVSLVNYDGETVFDTLVKVLEPVTDYRTFVSGITAEDLASDSAISFIECQLQVSELIRDRIVVGHGLKNDFRVLGIHHPWHLVRDTAKYEPFMAPCHPFESPTGACLRSKKLKVLAKDKLDMVIQVEGRAHSPVEDAVAALELYKKHRVKWEKAVEYKVNKTKEMTARS